MTLKITIGRGDPYKIQVDIDQTPGKCPICGVVIVPVDWTIGCVEGGRMERLLQCPNGRCRRLFLAQYRKDAYSYTFTESVPAEIPDIRQSATIKEISPDFCEIFNQAHKAEMCKLKLVAGPGYRKALEFLIKDYLSTQPNGDTDEAKAAYRKMIENSQLGHSSRNTSKMKGLKRQQNERLGSETTKLITFASGKTKTCQT